MARIDLSIMPAYISTLSQISFAFPGLVYYIWGWLWSSYGSYHTEIKGNCLLRLLFTSYTIGMKKLILWALNWVIRKKPSTVQRSKTITTICEPALGILYMHLSLGTSFTFFIQILRENNGGKHWDIGGKYKILRASTSLFLSRLNILYNLV